jgi:hypothetical protein
MKILVSWLTTPNPSLKRRGEKILLFPRGRENPPFLNGEKKNPIFLEK